MQTEKVSEYIITWLKEYVSNANMDGFVVGISGGIDSAVVSSLCARTGMPTLCVELPIHQHPSHLTRSNQHIEELMKKFANVSNLEVDLSPVFDQFKKTVPDESANPKLDLSLANTRARLRMTTLYYFAGLQNYLVAGTGNKVEDFGIGFYTKYGDGGVDLSPIGDLMKSEVYDLAHELDIHEHIITAPPTDGLFGDSRSDEDQIGASYEELEWAMKMDEEGKTENAYKGRQKEVFKIYKTRNRNNRHKMNPIPVCHLPVHLK